MEAVPNKRKTRMKIVDHAPPLPPKGHLNYGLQELRTLGDRYAVDPAYLEYILKFRAEWCPPQMIEKKTGILRQTYFQPAAAVPNNYLVKEIQKNLVKYGCHPKDDYPRFKIDAKYDCAHTDIWVHMVLGVLDLEELYDYNFDSVEEIETIRHANLKKADKLNRRWGPFFWNVHWPPMPQKFCNDKGRYVLDDPLLTSWKSPLWNDLIKRDQHGVIVDEEGIPLEYPNRAPFNQLNSSDGDRKRPSSKQKEVKSRDLFSFGFKPVEKKVVKKKA